MLINYKYQMIAVNKFAEDADLIRRKTEFLILNSNNKRKQYNKRDRNHCLHPVEEIIKKLTDCHDLLPFV